MRHSFHPVRFGLISLLSLAIALGSAHLSRAQTKPPADRGSELPADSNPSGDCPHRGDRPDPSAGQNLLLVGSLSRFW